MKYEANIKGIEQALEDLKKQWMLKNLDIEIKISQASRSHSSKDEREIIKYSTSSAIKRIDFYARFARNLRRQCTDCIPISA